MQTAKGVPDMISTRTGSLSLLAGAMLLASASAFATVEPVKPVTTAKELQQAKTYTVSSAPTEALNLAAPKLPDISGYTAEAAAAKIVRSKPGKISVRRMMQEDALKDFIGGDNKMAEWVVRQHGIPQAIFVDDGYMNLKDLAQKLPKQYFSETSPGVYLSKLPIVVGRKGILEIDGQTQELRLSQEAGAFMVNDGQLFVRDTKITGWRERITARRPSVRRRNSVRSCSPGAAPRPTSSTARWPASATPTVSRTG